MEQEMSYKVYALIAPDGRKYIGMTHQALRLRCRKDGYNGCPAMNAAISKFGWKAFTTTILFDGLTKQQAEQYEKESIARYDTTNPLKGFNVALGGNIEGRHSGETRQRMSDSQKGRVFTQEHIAKLRKPKLDGALRRKVCQFTIDGQFIKEHASLTEAAEAVRVCESAILNCCNHRSKTSAGYKWEYGGGTR